MKKIVLTALTGLTVLGSSALPALAHDPYYDNHYNNNNGRFQLEEHPYLKKAIIGGGGGALLGGLLSEGDRMDGALTGAMLGAGAGLGYEYLKNKGIIPDNGW